MKRFISLFVLVPLLFAGCMTVPAGLSPSISPITKGDYTVLGHSTGKISYFSLFGIFPFGKPDYDAAIRDAVGKYPEGTSLINVRSTFKTVFVLVGSIHTLIVTGDVVR